MKRKTVSGIMLSLLLVAMLILTFNIQPVRAEPSTIIVPDDYEKIQWAIGNASDGDTIFVRAGTYYEHVTIDKSISLIGENKHNTIIDGGAVQRHVIYVVANNVTISSFTLQRGGRDGWPDRCGIYIDSSDNNNISNNIITNNVEGIFACISDSNVFENNIVHTNNMNGIWLYGSSNNIITNNTISNHGHFGIILGACFNNLIFHNNFINNKNQYFTTTESNTWDNGYPYGGNYWSDHVCTGNPSDGSHPYIIDENNIDHYPFQDPNGWLLPPPSDINGDGIVDVHDVVIASLAFGSRPGDPNWNPQADLNNDGVIDIFDMVIIGVHYGETW